MVDRGSVLVVAAHPDDEVLGCGATMARHAEAGAAVRTFIVGEGATARSVDRVIASAQDEVSALRAAARSAATILGTQPPSFGGFADNRLDGVELLEIVKTVERIVAEFSPQVVYTHHGGDLNVDHRRVHDAVLTACRPLPGSAVRAIYSFEVLSSTGWMGASRELAFVPTRFVDVTATLARKLDALKAYSGEMRAFPHARSIEAVTALAQLRGATVGLAAAEAFQVEREIC
jgi:LmbE family N-acetylglucosaminyl deacetylase